MFFGFSILDILLILTLLGYLITGIRKGFLVTLGGIAGFAGGAVAAFFAIPVVSAWVPDSGWRLTAVIATAVVLIVLGHAVGSGLGASIRRGLKFPALNLFDRLLGGAANTVVAALVMSILAFSVGNLGQPFLSRQIAGSAVISTINRLTPTPVQAWIAQGRAYVLSDGIPQLLEPFGPVVPMPVPDASTQTPALERAAESVLKITGTAIQCGQNQTGSGFAVASDRVMTNAHVVAGVNEPVVELRSGEVKSGRVVHFDPVRDLAVIAVDGLGLQPIPAGGVLRNGSFAAFAGFPGGGPFQSRPASIQTRQTVQVQNIYGSDPFPVEVYQLAANVQQGNSGGPLLDEQGRLAGVVFAKATDDAPLGYALTLAEARQVIDESMVYRQTVSAGQCTRK